MDESQDIKKIELEEATLRDLNTTRKWSMFLAILQFIGIGVMVIIAIIAVLFLFVFRTEAPPLGIGEIMILLLVLFVALIYFIPVLYLYRFARHTGNAVRAFDKTEMRKAFKYLKRYYVYIGILVLLSLVIYLLIFIITGASVDFLNDIGTGI